LTLDEYAPEVRRFVEEIRDADALIVSTGAYHGTLAGVTKNALDYIQFLSRDERPYLDGRVVGLISTAGGDQAAANANAAMVHAVHALRGIVAPLMVTIPKSWQRSEGGEITDNAYNARLGQLGALVVDFAGRLQRTDETRTIAGAVA
ncbi:MAG TPA: NAD(P)H-dependent oxidoreductase, partial [Rubrobacteraceae bacterium]|nr:NAD(P)H-dependent oxidoreductase [Rubrobacteraceae bacterium]